MLVEWKSYPYVKQSDSVLFLSGSALLLVRTPLGIRLGSFEPVGPEFLQVSDSVP